MVISSLIFYAFGEIYVVFLMILSITGNYWMGRFMNHPRLKKPVMILAVVLNLLTLFIFKYLGFFITALNSAANLNLPVPNIVLPIGISFFTFQAMSYVIDAYRDESLVERKLSHIFLYISFFPQLIAGPIIRFADIAEQMRERTHTLEKTVYGIKRFIYGLSKKLILANAMGALADQVFGSLGGGSLSLPIAWVGALCYTMQIFFDFSGYSDMAIGLGKLFGFTFKENFNYPYTAGSMTEFWRRWNISVSTWFKEYAYIPLGGNRKGRLRTNLNKIIVFFLTGLWHGANFTFVLWGMLHGLFLMLENLRIIPAVKARNWLTKGIFQLYTLLVVVVTFVIFRADSVRDGLYVIGRMFAGSLRVVGNDLLVLGNLTPYVVFLFIAGLFVAFRTGPKAGEALRAGGRARLAEAGSMAVTMILFLFCVLSLSSSTYNPFIYFRF